jgi:hypothetical protein
MPGLALVELVAGNDGTEALDDVIEDLGTFFAIDVQLVEDLLGWDGSVDEISHIDTLGKVNTSHLALEELAHQELRVGFGEVTHAIVSALGSVSGLSSLLLVGNTDHLFVIEILYFDAQFRGHLLAGLAVGESASRKSGGDVVVGELDDHGGDDVLNEVSLIRAAWGRDDWVKRIGVGVLLVEDMSQQSVHVHLNLLHLGRNVDVNGHGRLGRLRRRAVIGAIGEVAAGVTTSSLVSIQLVIREGILFPDHLVLELNS